MRSLLVKSFAAILMVALLSTSSSVDATVFNPGANGTAAMSASLFNKVFADFIPVIEQIGPDIPIGPLSGKNYNIGQFHLNNIEITDIEVGFASPSSLQVSISGLGASVPKTPFSVFTHIFGGELPKAISSADLKLSCSGDASASVSGASAIVDVELSTSPSGQLVATVQTPTLKIDNVNADLDLHGFCKIASGIIDLFHHEFDSALDDVLQHLLPKKIQSVLQSQLSKDLPKVPVKFVSTPSVAENNLQVDLEIIKPFSAPMMVPVQTAPAVPDAAVVPHIFLNKDISIGINSQSFNDIIATAALAHGFDFSKEISGKYNTSIFEFLIPAVYQKCMDCPFDIYFDIQKHSPPTVTFGPESLVFNIINAEMNFTASNSGAEENLFSTFANISFGVKNFSVADSGTTTDIKFGIEVLDFNLELGYSFIGPIGLSKFSSFVQGTLQDVIVPLFNAGFKGFPLSLVYDGFGLDSWEVDLNSQAISFGANLVLPSTAAKLEQHLIKYAMQNGIKL